MDWTYLGHAMWLIEAEGLRLLCDPLLGRTHHGGVFEVVPRRRIDPSQLQADFVFVSHRHADHFDVPSLDLLAQADADSVIVTPDALVVWAARALGFRDVRQIAPGTRIALDGVDLVTTRSTSPDEWGLMVATSEGTAWNQIDSVFDASVGSRAVLDAALLALDRDKLDLTIVCWQPMLEVAAQLGHDTNFPLRAYDRMLRDIVALDAGAVVPAASGDAHVAAWSWLDRVVYPVSEARFSRDVRQLRPGASIHPARIGARYRVRGGETSWDPAPEASIVEVEPTDDVRSFFPVQLPALADPNLAGASETTMRPPVQAWLDEALVRGLDEAWPTFGAAQPIRLLLEIVWPSTTEHHTFVVGPQGTSVERRWDPDWDALNQVAGSQLWEVVEGRRSWGDVLLAGALRARTRAYRVEADGLRPLRLGLVFLYYGLSYEASFERSVRWQVEAALAQRT